MKAIFVLIVVISVVIAGAVVWYMSHTDYSQSPAATALAFEGRMPSLDRSTEWINSTRLTDADLRGKVVVIEFWTYSCINWRRQLPYVRAWFEKYKDKGLVVIGVHTPEFEFEKNTDLVRLASKNTKVDYPVVLDSDYSIWNSFSNRYWPALYFVDIDGNIRHHQFGEGGYEQSERIIQMLLAESGISGVAENIATVDATGAEAPADWNDLVSPENYVGFDRTQNFASAAEPKLNEAFAYELPSQLNLGDWALSGNWTIGHQATTLNSVSGGVRYRFHARDLHLVMGPETAGEPIRFRILIDGQPPGAAHGVDIDEQGNGIAREPRMYQLIRQQRPISDRTFEIQFLDPHIQIFSFTFG